MDGALNATCTGSHLWLASCLVSFDVAHYVLLSVHATYIILCRQLWCHVYDYSGTTHLVGSYLQLTATAKDWTFLF